MSPKLKKKPPEKSDSIFFQKIGVEFMKIARILGDPGIVKSFPTSSVKFPMPTVTYTLTIAISAKFFNFNQFVSNLDFFLANPNSPPCKCNKSSFDNRHHKYIVIGDLQIIENNVLRKHFIEAPKYRGVSPIHLESAMCYILEVRDNYILSWCSKNGVDKSCHVCKRLDKKAKVNFKIYNVANWITNNYNTHIARYLKK